MCYFPWRAQSQENGKPLPSPEGDLLLPCGKCLECKKLNAKNWATRVKHELHFHKHNTFINLTYAQIPHEQDLKKNYANFIKKLRDKIKPKKIKHFTAHEYGSKFGRPHHHSIIFGHDFEDLRFLKKSQKGHSLYSSETLTKLWGHGHANIGEANVQTAYYIASYTTKRETIEAIAEDGEITTLKDSLTQSNGIGLKYLIRYTRSLILSGEPLPRYYQKKLLEFYENYNSKEYKDKMENKFPEIWIRPRQYWLDQLCDYETNIMFNIKHRDPQQNYSKFLLDHSFNSDSEYRSKPKQQIKLEKTMQEHLHSDLANFNAFKRRQKDLK